MFFKEAKVSEDRGVYGSMVTRAGLVSEGEPDEACPMTNGLFRHGTTAHTYSMEQSPS